MILLTSRFSKQSSPKYLWKRPTSLAITTLVIFITVSPNSGAQDKKPAKKAVPLPQHERMTAAYSLDDGARDPFFTLDQQFQEKPPVIPTDPTARELLPLLNISGIIGKPENPDAAGLLIDAKLYRIGDSIPVRFGNSAYQLVLVRVDFPDDVVLKYKDETVTLAVNKNKKNGD